MGDTTFVGGGTVGSNTQLVARLSDKNGINISSQNPANDLIAVLDSKWTYIVNDFYRSDKDDFTKGWIAYPLDTLQPGSHTLTLSASDNLNNTSSETVNFTVSGGTGIAIGEFHCFPNPFNSNTDKVTFQFTHTRSSEDLEATIDLFDIAGQPVAELDYAISESTYQVNIGEWNGENSNGIKFLPGLYVAKLSVRSLVDGSKNERIAKLIIVN
jgi:hypothetical protein